MIELSEQLVYWTAPHPSWRPNPEWPRRVGCALYRHPDALVLVDPLVEDRLWSWLDGEVALAEGRVVVLLTAPWHLRSTPMVSARYAAPVWAIEAARACLDDLPWLKRLPTGIRAFVPRGTTVAGHDRCPGVRSVDARA